MDIFNRKKLAAAEAEIERLKEMLTNSEQTYKQELNNARDYIAKLEAKTTENNKRKNIYSIRDTVLQNRKYIDSVYCSKRSFFTSNEYQLYQILCTVIANVEKEKSVNLSLFSHVRLADVVRLWEEYYNNPSESKKSFVHCKTKNRYKQQIDEEIQRLVSDFDENDYKETFLYPLLSRHIDFLVCINIDDENKSIPICAIELNGSEHSTDFKRQKSDELKRDLFNAAKVDLLTLDNDTLRDRGALESVVFGRIIEILIKRQ